MDYALLGGAHAERGRKLFLTGLSRLALAVLYLSATANVATNPSPLQSSRTNSALPCVETA